MILQDIKETKRYGHTFGRSDVRTDGRTDNVKTVYPPTNTVCGGYNQRRQSSAENMWRKPMSRQHAPHTDGRDPRCIIYSDESTASIISTQCQIDTNERIKLETSIHTFTKYKATMRSTCILHPMYRKNQSVPGGEEALPAAQTT